MQNGLTASRLPPDFVYSWQRLVDPKTASPYASYPQYGHIVNVDEIIDGKKAPSELGVKAIDDHTLEVTLSEPVPYFYKLLVNPAMSPVYKPAIEKFGESGRSRQYRYQRRVYSERLGGQRADRDGA